MKKKRGWYLRGRYVEWLELIFLLAGPFQTRREARVWYDGATKINDLTMTCEFVDAKTIDQWQRLGILRNDIWEPGGPIHKTVTRARLTIARIEQALDDGEITLEQLAQLLPTSC